MKKLIIASVFVALVAPEVYAGPTKNQTGAVLLLGGSVTIAAAFDYHHSCPSGYSTSTIGRGASQTTYCVYVSRYSSDVYELGITPTLGRPTVLKVGIGAAAAGTVLLLLPKRAAKHAPSVSFT